MPLAEDLIFSHENFGFGLMPKIQLQSYSEQTAPTVSNFQHKPYSVHLISAWTKDIE